MTERSINEVTDDTDDVSYAIKRARICHSSPTKPEPESIDSNKISGYSNGTSIDNESTESTCCESRSSTVSSDDNRAENQSVSSPPSQPSLQTLNPVMWVQKQIEGGVNPMSVLVNILPPNVALPEGLSDLTLWRIVIEILSDVPKRTKLPHINTLHDVVSLLKSCHNIMVVSGAGISVSCGIPDFRSRDGIYSRLRTEFPDLPSPQSMFDIQYFAMDPKPFYKFASEMWPGSFDPSPSHNFIKHIEERGRLLRIYTQNIDTLEKRCGISNVVECHGSFATATCRECGYKVQADLIKKDIMTQNIPVCKKFVINVHSYS